MATAKKSAGRTANKARITRGPARAVARSKTAGTKLSAQSKRQGKAKAKAKSAAMMARPSAKATAKSKTKAKVKPVKAKSRPAARKAAPKKKKQIVGEGDYQASRRFLKDQGDFVARNETRIPQMGKDAAKALDGAEGDSLRDAEETARARSRE